MIRFKESSPTISQIFQYTLRSSFATRFEYSKRDILPSRLKITQRKRYTKNKEGKYSAPNELLTIQTCSAPQYKPYILGKSKNAKKQTKVKHTYRMFVAIQLDKKNQYSFNSRIIWRIGSFAKPDNKPPQKYVKTIYPETREKIIKKSMKEKDPKKRAKFVKTELNKIKKNAPYLNAGDYNAQVKGVMLDAYYRSYPIQAKFGCLYGAVLHSNMPKQPIMPYFDKHTLALLAFLLRKGVLKTS